MRRLSLQKQAVNPLYCHCLLRIDHQIPVLATVVTEEPGKGYRDLAVCKPLSLSPSAVLRNESWLAKADKMGTISGSKVDKSEEFAWTMGENGAPLIDEAKVSIECEVDGNYELEHFDHFICKILATYADESVLNDKDKIDYHTFKPVLFEFPTYEYFVTGEKVGDCGKMN